MTAIVLTRPGRASRGGAFESAERHYRSFGHFLALGLGVGGAMAAGLRRVLLGDVMPPQAV